MSDRILVIPCGSKKLDHAAPARELYSGSLFRAGLNAAERSGREPWIISAKWGLVHPDVSLEPYNQQMTEHTAHLVGNKIRAQALAIGIHDADVVALLPGLYLAAARIAWPDLVDEFAVLPEGRRGLGYQMQLLARYATPRQIGATA